VCVFFENIFLDVECKILSPIEILPMEPSFVIGEK
jgi:hypothetical protein